MLSIIKKMLPERLKIVFYSSKGYKAHFGHYPNLINPKTFSEKLQKYKVFFHDQRMVDYQDKVLVKSIVEAKLGKEFVIPLIWHGEHLPPRNQRNWPAPYVIKANHGCGWNIFVMDPATADWDQIEEKCQQWMNQRYGYYVGEWLYSRINPQLLVEPFVSDNTKLPNDYKFWVFNGKVEYIQVITGRRTEDFCQAMYNIRWERQPCVACAVLNAKHELERPASLNTMIAAAEKLAEDLPFIRVDFYEVDKKPLFGEVTFYPASGYSQLQPTEYENIFGALWR